MSYQITITDLPVKDFNGVTVRKAMFDNGDYVDLKAFAADPADSKREYLRSLKPLQKPIINARLSMNGKFRQLVLEYPLPI